MIGTRLFVRYQLTDISLFRCRDHGAAAQLSLALLSLGRKQVSLKTLVTLDLPAGGYPKPFGRGSVGLDLWHFNLPLGLLHKFTWV
jgi:hypothetical protein